MPIGAYPSLSSFSSLVLNPSTWKVGVISVISMGCVLAAHILYLIRLDRDSHGLHTGYGYIVPAIIACASTLVGQIQSALMPSDMYDPQNNPYAFMFTHIIPYNAVPPSEIQQNAENNVVIKAARTHQGLVKVFTLICVSFCLLCMLIPFSLYLLGSFLLLSG